MLKFFDRFKKTSKDATQSPSKELFKKKYDSFQSLLSKNNRVLELMADMEEKLSGEYLFDNHYIQTITRSISAEVSGIVENLDTLSHGRYRRLFDQYNHINDSIEKILSPKKEIPVSDFTIPIENLGGETSNISGGKIAHLGEIKNQLNFLVPDGFSITAFAFKRFIEHNRLGEKINDKLSALEIGDTGELNRASKEIQDMVIDAEIPDDLRRAIKETIEGLKVKLTISKPSPVEPSMITYSVRSSAIQEDGEFSFAGQYATFLNVREDFIIQKYKEVVASLFTPRAIFYYKTKGFSEEDMVMAVGVLRMIDAKAAGVMFTKDPNDPESDSMIVNAVWGLGKMVVDGSLECDSYVASRRDGTVLRRKIAGQNTMLVCSDKGETDEVSVPDELRGNPCLTDDQIKALCSSAMILENHFGKPQDIEWVIDKDNRIFILQSRQLKTLAVPRALSGIPRRIEKYNILIDKGIIACKGIGFGKAFLLKDESDLKDFPEGAVLVTKNLSTNCVVIMDKASALVADIGSIAGHVASLTREYHVPTLLDTGVATTRIQHGQEITVDAVNCNVYEGRVDEILRYAGQRSTFKETHIYITMQKIYDLIVPLNLTSPDGENFRPECCRTFHDITRFAHEKAMDEMFSIGEKYDPSKLQTIDLKAEIPIDIHLIDIDGGLKENIKKATHADILSVPFAALIRGMRGMKWPEPRPSDVKGFLGIMATTANIPEEQLYEAGKASFAVISRNYMNFSVRLGYHFSLIEAFAGENINDNYIKFHFKGGGAVLDRRLRRVKLIETILKKMDFHVDVKMDVITASLTKYTQSIIEDRLIALGKLTAYTKQLDMALFNDAIMDMYAEQFITEHLSSSTSL